jgi:transposase
VSRECLVLILVDTYFGLIKLKSMSTGQKTIIRYSISFKRKVVTEIEDEGLGIREAARRYGIKGGRTVQSWIAKFGKYHLLNKIMRVETMEEKDRIKQLEEENSKLKIALADSLMANRCLEVVIEEADKGYEMGLKKKLDALASNDLRKNTK